MYGKNEIPTKESPSFLELCWEAAQDATLIMLFVSLPLAAASSVVCCTQCRRTPPYPTRHRPTFARFVCAAAPPRRRAAVPPRS